LEAHADTNAAGGSAFHVVVNRASSGAHWQSIVGVLYMVELLLPIWRVGPNLVFGLPSCRGFTRRPYGDQAATIRCNLFFIGVIRPAGRGCMPRARHRRLPALSPGQAGCVLAAALSGDTMDYLMHRTVPTSLYCGFSLVLLSSAASGRGLCGSSCLLLQLYMVCEGGSAVAILLIYVFLGGGQLLLLAARQSRGMGA